jgi:uncharacterized membrane protein YoaK (UPF0700 family)
MPPEHSPQPGSLSDALFLAATGGLLDAVVYLNHGHVFANAMTGNVIFLGIAVLGRDWRQIIPHFVPLIGFFAGVTSSKHLRTRLAPHAALLGLSFEILALLALSFLPATFPQMAFTGIIAYVAAFQVASFRHVDRFSFNSTFVTGNLRDVAEGLYEASSPASSLQKRQKGRAQARDLSLICLCFLLGAVLGAWAAPRFGNHSFLFAEPLLIAVALHTLRQPS